jgi:hypothetical protein
MKHHYKSILFAAMALAVWSASFFLGSFNAASWRNRMQGKLESPKQKDVADIPEETLNSIHAIIAKKEYNISFDEKKGALQSPNRKQNLRAYYKPGKLTIQNRVDSAGQNFKLNLITEGIYADGNRILTPQRDAETEAKENELLINHEGFTEEFVNNEEGVRQNFVVNKAPKGTREIQVRLSPKGLKARNGENNEVHFYTENTKGEIENRLVYSDLKCWDANKQPLDASLTYVDNHVRISVDVENAAYPVTIDPIVVNGNPNNANKTIENNQNNSWLGYSVASAGDLDGNGYSDIVIGCPKYDNGHTDEGAIYVFPGNAWGIGFAGGKGFESQQTGAQLGFSVSSAGDIDHDGYSDIVAGAPYYDKPFVDEGVVFLYKGSKDWFTAGNNPIPTIIEADQANAGYGISVALAGDVNSDGFSDVLVGAHLYDKDQANEGAAFLYYGSGMGLQMNTMEILDGNQSGAMMGYAVAGAGDVNADGASDILVGSRLYSNGQTYEGAVFVYKGNVDSNPVTGTAPQIIESGQIDARMGHAVSTAGDVNGDGYSDIAIGVFLYDNQQSNEGAVYIHHGSQNGVEAGPKVILESNQIEAQMGWSVASAGDVNGDGYGDIIVGSRFYDNGQANEGAAFVYHGSSDGILSTFASMLESNQGEAWMGGAVASAGDVNGDGYSDIIIGVYTYDHGENDEGTVFVYHGKPDVIGTYAKTMTSGTPSNAFIGSSVSPAGDVNGDGLDDVIIGAPSYDTGQINGGAAFISYGSVGFAPTINTLQINQDGAKFGCSVSKAGDVNGDGYDDVIVGASGVVINANQIGAAYIFHGSSLGILSGAAPAKQLFFGNQGFGTSVSDAGDINSDGYDDIIVGVPSYSKSNPSLPLCGAVFIYKGSAGGIDPQTLSIVTPLQAGDQLGNSVDNAGDVNGDGYSDIVAGASQATLNKNKEGAVYLWYGSFSGIPTNALYNDLLTVNQGDARMGISVAGAGDVNGDGYSDIIAGADLFDNGQSDEGIARVYYGAALGCTDANMTTLEANQSLSGYAHSVGGAGDVNGDGYSDVIVGASYYDNGTPNEGAAFVYHGSPLGISTTSSFTVEGEDNDAHLGEAVSGAGDLNGDGYSDILVGTPGYDLGGSINLGNARAYYGNNGLAGKNRRHNIRLYNSDKSTLMNITQVSKADVGVGMFGTSFLGRNNARMVWGVVAHGTSFPKEPGYPITNSTVTTNGQNSYMTTLMAGYEYSELVSKQSFKASRLRVRIKHELTTALTGQVYGPWRYVPEYLIYNQGATPPELAAEELGTEVFQDAKPEYKNLVTIYPNPVADKLFVKVVNEDQVKSMRLIAASGTMVYHSAKAQNEIDVRNLDAGIYILQVARKDGSQASHKVLIKK